MTTASAKLHVSLIAIPEAVISTLGGIYDVLNAFGMLAGHDEAIPRESPFEVEIVGEARGAITLASGLPCERQRAFGEIDHTDIVIVPSVLLEDGTWTAGRYPELVAWLGARHAQGALLCSACSGVFLLAETGLLDGREATIHWTYAAEFGRAFPLVQPRPDRALIATGARDELIMSGATTSWHDLVLYLIARHAGVVTAQAVARFFALQWHAEGLAPYVVFAPPNDHGDSVVADAQAWLATQFPVGAPVEELVRRSGLAERSFKRRFTKATGYAPIKYVQRLRVEDAKRRLERTEASVETIGWQVGYEDGAFFRRLFKRTTGISPGVYRHRFRIPGFEAASPPSNS